MWARSSCFPSVICRPSVLASNEKAHRFRAKRRHGVSKTQRRRLGMARRLPTAARIALAKFRSVRRRGLHRAQSHLRGILCHEAKLHRWHGDWLLFGSILLQRANARYRGLRPSLSANSLRPHRFHHRNYERHLSPRRHDRPHLRPFLTTGRAHRLQQMPCHRAL